MTGRVIINRSRDNCDYLKPDEIERGGIWLETHSAVGFFIFVILSVAIRSGNLKARHDKLGCHFCAM